MKNLLAKLMITFLLVLNGSALAMNQPNLLQRLNSLLTPSLTPAQANQQALKLLENWPYPDRPRPEEQKFTAEKIARLIAAGVNVNIENKDGNTLLLKAIWHDHSNADAVEAAEAVRMLLKAGAKVNGEKRPPLLDAAIASRAEIVKELLAAGANPNISNDDGQTPLWFAAAFGNIVMAQMLINAGAYVDTPDNKLGSMPLMRAVLNGDIPMIQLLMDAYADPTIKNKSGQTAMDLAHEKKAPKAIIDLLSRKPQKAR